MYVLPVCCVSLTERILAGSVPSLEDVTPHDLGLLSILMALGAMVQISSPNGMYPTQAADLYQIARISLSLDSVLDHPTVQAVRAVVRRA